ncbi:hypothetical protein [Roseovarius arcticus]|uniref:hypothetical protein n=1 Tax=Roseovarius arcticus TaxID=2547404 RepID=UPI001110E36C|nr:hypothetical protein [Roseovarius arcticus]
MRRQISERLNRLWAAAPIATVILVLSLIAATVFGARSAVFWINRPPPAERELTIATWMTPRYIARSWGVPPEVILDAIHAPRPPPNGPMSLTQLADYRGVTPQLLIEEAQAAIAAFRDRPRK